MGRAAAVLSARAAAFAVLAGSLAAYYASARAWPNVSTWWDVVILAFGVVPAVFGLVYAVLPFWRAPLAQLAAVAVALAAWTNRALPATPLLSFGFLAANCDLLWREVRRRPPTVEPAGTPSERGPARAD